MRFFYW